VVRTVGDCWLNAYAGRKRRQKLVNSGPAGTEELGLLASVHEYTELVVDSIWNVKPVKLSVHQS